ncbi:MAG: hypothetical protein IKZ87_00760 [Actinomycetaceae bacterium]|nr:hypothetical protein [Actinomycetaceae bacterium]
MPKNPSTDKAPLRYVIFDPSYGCENAIIWLWGKMEKGRRQTIFRIIRDFGVAALSSNKTKAHANAVTFGQKWMLRHNNQRIIEDSNPVRIALAIRDTSEHVRENISCGLARLATIAPEDLASGLAKMPHKGNEALRAAEMLLRAQAIIQSELNGHNEHHEQISRAESAHRLPTVAAVVDTQRNTNSASPNTISSRDALVSHDGASGQPPAAPTTPEHKPVLQKASSEEHIPEDSSPVPEPESPMVDWGSLAGFADMAYEGS